MNPAPATPSPPGSTPPTRPEHPEDANRSRARGDAPGRAPAPVPRISGWTLTWFAWYSRRYFARHFNALRLIPGIEDRIPADRPLVAYFNHPSWWDPILAVILGPHWFPGRRAYAPMDAAALEKYRFFARIGLFGVEQGTRRGALTFLRTAEAILARPDTLLWVTPQGRFCDVRERPVRLAAGLGALASRVHPAVFLPVAVEYVFWEERLPEVLVEPGDPWILEDPAVDREELDRRLAAALEQTQDRLAARAIRREAEPFHTLLHGRAGVGGIYDVWRRLKARWRGEPMNLRHGTR